MKSEYSAIRRFLLWWFSEPMSPWVSVNVSVDFLAAQDYLEKLALDSSKPKVSVQHLLCACIVRGLQKVPQANANIIGGRIFARNSIGMAMPVNLLGHKGGAQRELSLMLVKQVEQKSLRSLAEEGRNSVKQEREGKLANPFLKVLLQMVESLPLRASNRTFSMMERMMRQPRFANKVYELFPVTTVLSNPGSTLPREVDGVLFRSSSLNIPLRGMHIGSFWGISAIQKEVIPIQNVPTVRPMLPILLIFDHRLIDGVKATQLMMEVVSCLQNPEPIFGETGQLPLAISEQ